MYLAKNIRRNKMANYNEFNNDDIEHALAAARAHNETVGITNSESTLNHTMGGEYSVLAQCISVTVTNNKVCLNLPLGIGSVCLPIPFNIPNGTAAQACLTICTTWGIPTGVKVTVSVAGVTIVSKVFGKC
jgi:hypothetical protein